jgi:hypothetical protein
MLSMNFKLILRIFFMILLGMLFGLTLLSFNLQRLFEVVLTYVLLFFEKQSMRLLVLKNLTAHKLRNKMTSIIFSLALGFIVFLIVSYNLQIRSSSLIVLRRRGSYLSLYSGDTTVLNPLVMDPIFYSHRDKIKGFAYITYQLSRFEDAKISKLELSDRARINL